MTVVGVLEFCRRERVLSNLIHAITLGILPIASIAFLGWIAVKSVLGAPHQQNYSLLGFLVAGFILLFIARFVLRSPFFSIRRESWSPPDSADKPSARHRSR